jgi:hypothetical protein
MGDAAQGENPKDRKDLLVPTMVCTWEIAMSVISNKFSSQLNWWGLLLICLVPLVLSLVWLYKREQEQGKLMKLWLGHPVSYSLIALISILFFWNTTSILIAKLRQPPTAQIASIPANAAAGGTNTGVTQPSPSTPGATATPERPKPSTGAARHQALKPNLSSPATTQPTSTVPATPPGSLVQTNSGGVNVQQGTTGSDSPIINSPITIGSFPKAISPQDMTTLKTYFLRSPVKPEVAITTDQYSGAVPFPDDFYDVLKNGGWKMKETGANHMMVFSAPGRTFQGVVVKVYGDPIPPGQVLNLSESDPIAYIGNALEAFKIPHTLIRTRDQPEGLITISFVGGFPN